MNTKNRISAAALLAAASLTFSPAAWSLGLGDATVESFLNQPLQVKIDLISRETDDLTTVRAQLASAADYELIGASRESVSVPIGFTIEDADGDAYIMATSTLPVGNPVVRLIVEVNWSSGRLLREYTVFLDPVTIAQAAPIPRIEQRKAPPPVAVPVPADTVEPPAAPAERPPSEVQPAPAATSPRLPAEGEYGPVASGQTLWGIASDWSRGTGLDLNKVMIAIQRENPEAFLRNNINLLKRGAILRMPQVDDVRQISMASAIDEVSAQADAFRGAGQAEPATSPSTPLLADEAAAADEQASQAETAAPESAAVPVDEASAPEGEAAEDGVEASTESAAAETDTEYGSEPDLAPQLELVPPSAESELDSAYGFEESDEAGADASVAVSALREDLARTEEELITQQQQNEYLAERIRELEAQVASAESDSIEDADAANMENRLREERLARAAEEAENAPWYKKYSAWLIGLLVLAAAIGGWLLSRRGSGDEYAAAASDEDPLREIKDEAEEVLRVLKDSEDDDSASAEDATETVEVEAGETEAESDAEETAEEQREVNTFGSDSGDAEVLDEDSSDPEIQLDLARAYISMGDKEAARVILEEVGNNGTEEQREEARKMLDLLVP
ncbi:MAG: tetratricopeptide repeat protein [Xanthomonadales bacterium]|nr:tetratricopeptide repeat protein [Gammaproteobacteria bacterium]MBT8054702.1 tetratricopeptide repeat protein [Gammaproteobacteria bacterium]NND57804.1 tetratricopeptide repeat protein [Xanthomonadales bacterium]NNK51453.1 tetratricopeptide repeat protein [Xanthomonadales bacterium]